MTASLALGDDGATLKSALAQTEQLTAIRPKQASVDQGFRGNSYHPPDVEVLVCGTRKLTTSLKPWLKRRSAIEPVIGHSKQDHALGRNFLHGRTGDLQGATTQLEGLVYQAHSFQTSAIK